MYSDSDDDDKGTRRYPGLGHPKNHDPPLRYLYPLAPRGRAEEECQSTPLPVREVAMMLVMDRITDKGDWHTAIFDPVTTNEWREEMLEKWSDAELWGRACRGVGWEDPIPRHYHANFDEDVDELDFDEEDDEERRARIYLDRSVPPLEGILDARSWDFIVEELKQKARYYEISGLIPTLDACHAVVKSDILVPEELRAAAKVAITKLKDDEADHPIRFADFGLFGWNPRNLVSPDRYPLIHGQTRGFAEEVVGVHDAVHKWSGKGDIINGTIDYGPDYTRENEGDATIDESWSTTYQCLPANVVFQDDGSVKFTSYINGLHPVRYPDVYQTLERLLEKVLPLWDQCLTQDESSEEPIVGRRGTRMPLDKYLIPGFKRADESTDDDDVDTEDPSAFQGLRWASPSRENSRPTWLNDEGRVRYQRRQARSPYPSITSASKIDYQPVKDSSLFNVYRKRGLQVLVKIVSLDTDGSSDANSPAGQWHFEYLMNERIIGSAIYYADCENATNEGMGFRMQTAGEQLRQGEIIEGNSQDDKEWLCRIWGTNLFGGPGIQNYGDVEVREGRILAWSNVFQRRALPFKTIDPTKPAHRRYIMFHLVDPRLRILSTANVPPQQRDWWFESISSGNNGDSSIHGDQKRDRLWETLNRRLPTEICQMIYDYVLFDDYLFPITGWRFLLSEENAKKFAQNLQNSRDDLHEATNTRWSENCYEWWD